MRKLNGIDRIVVTLFIVIASLHSQDKYPITRFTSDSAREGFPSWSPDGRFIVFDGDTGASIRMMDAEGGSPIKFLPDSIGIYNGGLSCWSATGSHIAFKEASSSWLWIYEVKTGAVAKIFREEGMLSLPGCWSRDG